VSDSGDALWNGFADKPFNSLSLSAVEKHLISGYFFFRHQPCIDRVIFLAVPHRGSRLAAGIVGSIGNRLIGRSKTAAEAVKELAAENPGVLNRYFAGVRVGAVQPVYSRSPRTRFWIVWLPCQLWCLFTTSSVIGDLTAELEVPTGLCRTAALTWLEQNPKRSYLPATPFF
jgi:hypothetical protein